VVFGKLMVKGDGGGLVVEDLRFESDRVDRVT
jgi:hypothetical protein